MRTHIDETFHLLESLGTHFYGIMSNVEESIQYDHNVALN